MRSFQTLRLIVLAAVLAGSLPGAAYAQASRDQVDFDQAAAAFAQGDTALALAGVERILARSPDDPNALYLSALYNFRLGNNEAARGRLERLVKESGNLAIAWESLVAVSQAQGDLARRNQALDRLKLAIRSAIDPRVRRKADIVRDRIAVGGAEIMGVEYFQRGGSDFTRYQFTLGDPREQPDVGLLLRTDAYTSENWAATALMPSDKQLFHLDLVEPQPGGDPKVAVYEYYVGEPDYDKVRAKVMQILRGEAKPLSGAPGKPGGLSGILKR
ncbi:MAG: hypothetical protein EXR07_20605 [Acetobacteraceae bacterium]|nr:hypothetical protein [Acetobacteraceae bacterium]